VKAGPFVRNEQMPRSTYTGLPATIANMLRPVRCHPKRSLNTSIAEAKQSVTKFANINGRSLKIAP
jgi:hypothetical protein